MDLASEETLHSLVGELLAQGLTNNEIVEQLQTIHTLNLENAHRLLREVYDSWDTIKTTLDIQPNDERNWHQYLRLKLLQEALKEESTIGRRFALRILDSLASVQGIATTLEQTTPLSIVLVEKVPEPEAEKVKGDNNVDETR